MVDAKHQVDPPWLEALIVVSLSVAALTTTWSTYQAALWDGEQAASYTRANALRIEGAKASARADILEAVDLAIFSSWLNAVGAGETQLQDFYYARFRPDFRQAFDAWTALHPLTNPDAPQGPFVMKEYSLPERVQAEALEAKAQAIFDQGQRDNDIGDIYVQATVILASALFFGGICQTFKRPKVRMILALLSSVACVIGVVRTLTLPAIPPAFLWGWGG
ncbi:MAG: hypothetical protein V4820_05580 [Pseudomonadota bacterium]